MDDSGSRPRIGQIVKILRGRNTGKYAVIIEFVDDKFALIADGDKRKFDQPKKKNILHLELQNEICREVVDSIHETGRVSNGKLRFVIQRFLDQIQLDAQEKGE